MHRIQFDFTTKAREQLDNLVKQTGAASRAEAVRRALALLDHAIKTKEQGGEILIRVNGKEQKLLIL
jgi:Arc/MetJ-type ribon-helix-helix transcriptional regulator